MEGFIMLFSILLPLLGGILLALMPTLRQDARMRSRFVGLVLVLECIIVVLLAFGQERTIHLMHLSNGLPIALRNDPMAIFFMLLITAMWTASGFFSSPYMEHSHHQASYFVFYLLTLSSLMAFCLSATLVTMYLFFEAVTLISMMLVLHERTKEAIGAGIKYLIYSVAGATMGLLGIFYLNPNTTSPYFVPGGSLSSALTVTPQVLLIVLFIAIVGFSTKAGMFPLHGWLPTAHPVAPAPASAVLSGTITKVGVLCVIRVIYYTVGADFLRGTWVQIALLSLACITVLMGSAMALKETLLKKRLAFSSVSQVSYVLCGIFLLNDTALSGSLLHIVFHALIKDCLFLCAGAIIMKTGLTYVDQLRGLGKRMPIVFASFAISSIGLIGIPPTGGFISKWFIAKGAIACDSLLSVPVFSWLVPVALLISALLTAGYLLPVCIHAFFSKPNPDISQETLSAANDGNMLIKVPLIILSALVVLLGAFPQPLLNSFRQLISPLF